MYLAGVSQCKSKNENIVMKLVILVSVCLYLFYCLCETVLIYLGVNAVEVVCGVHCRQHLNACIHFSILVLIALTSLSF